MEPGDVVAFHGLTVHGAGGNQRDDIRRRGYTVRYTGDDARYDTRPGTASALLMDELQDGDAMDGSVYPLVCERATGEMRFSHPINRCVLLRALVSVCAALFFHVRNQSAFNAVGIQNTSFSWMLPR